MHKEDSTFEVKGVVLEAKPNENFIVKIELEGREAQIIATISGGIRRNRIRVTAGDKVTVCISKYDLKRGRITFRDR